jgi:hypothetical protein
MMRTRAFSPESRKSGKIIALVIRTGIIERNATTLSLSNNEVRLVRGPQVQATPKMSEVIDAVMDIGSTAVGTNQEITDESQKIIPLGETITTKAHVAIETDMPEVIVHIEIKVSVTILPDITMIVGVIVMGTDDPISRTLISAVQVPGRDTIMIVIILDQVKHLITMVLHKWAILELLLMLPHHPIPRP